MAGPAKRRPLAGAADPFAYADRTAQGAGVGPTEAHRALGADKKSFMLEQVRSVWIVRNWCMMFSFTLGSVLPAMAKSFLEQQLVAPATGRLLFLLGGTVGVLVAFLLAWLSLVVIRRVDDAVGGFSEEELQDRRAVSLSVCAAPACLAWTVSVVGLAGAHMLGGM